MIAVDAFSNGTMAGFALGGPWGVNPTSSVDQGPAPNIDQLRAKQPHNISREMP
jgi:hypothetical protein